MLDFILSILVSWWNHWVVQSGNATVQGRGRLNVKLNGRAKYAYVYFTDSEVVTPCNPKSDVLSYELRGKDLHIEWDVSGVRNIKWYVVY